MGVLFQRLLGTEKPSLAWWLKSMAGLALFISLGMVMLPPLRDQLRLAFRVASLPLEQRMIHAEGATIASRIRTVIPAHEADAVVIDTSSSNRDLGVFLNYYLYPWKTRIPYGFNEYRLLPNRPPVLVHVDPERPDEIRRLTYLQFRDLYLQRARIAESTTLRRARNFIVPLAASQDGQYNEVFVTEATLRNPHETPIRVTIEFLPHGQRRDITVGPRETKGYYDLIFQVFEMLHRGWLRVTADQEIEAAFWLVNRGPDVATPLAMAPAGVSLPRIRELSVTVPSRLWFVNTAANPAVVSVRGETLTLGPYASDSLEIQGEVSVDAPTLVLSFTSHKDENLVTHFGWPEGIE